MNSRSTAQYQNVDDYTAGEKISELTGGEFVHEIHKVNRKNDDTTFYKKTVNSRFEAAIEATAGQIFNLLMPYQPQTLLAKNSQDNLFILSQEIPGYKSLADQYTNDVDALLLKTSLNSGKISGFGSVMTAAYFLNETDAKLGNLGTAIVNNELKVIKIDNNWCLSALQSPNQFGDSNPYINSKITEDGIKMIPIMRGYKTHNWLDFSSNGQLNKTYLLQGRNTLINDKLVNEEHFRNEVNKSMLQIMLLPDELLKEIASKNTNEEKYSTSIAGEIINRQTQMQQSALLNVNFNNYLQTAEAKQCVTELLHNITQFQSANHLSNSDFADKINQQFHHILSENKISLLENNITTALASFGDSLNDSRDKYKVLNQFKADIQKQINTTSDATELKQLESQLGKVTTIMHDVKTDHMIKYKTELLNRDIQSYWGEGINTESAIKLSEIIAEKAKELSGLCNNEGDKVKYNDIANEYKQETERLLEENPDLSRPGFGGP